MPWSIDTCHIILWPISRDHIVGSDLEFIEIRCFFEVDRGLGTTAFLLDRRLRPGYFIVMGDPNFD